MGVNYIANIHSKPILLFPFVGIIQLVDVNIFCLVLMQGEILRAFCFLFIVHYTRYDNLLLPYILVFEYVKYIPFNLVSCWKRKQVRN